MMLPPDVKILSQVQDARFDATTNTATPFIRVRFMVGPHGPFQENLDKATFTAASRDAALSAFADQVRT